MQFLTTTFLSLLAAASLVAAQGDEEYYEETTTPLIWPTANDDDSEAATVTASVSASVTGSVTGSVTASVTTYVTTVPWFTSVCNEPTTVTYQDAYYTATIAGQTITITNCPCTITTTSKVAATSGFAAKPTYVTAGAHKQAAMGVGALGAAVLALI